MRTPPAVEDDDTIGSLLPEGLNTHEPEVTPARSGRPALPDTTVTRNNLVLPALSDVRDEHWSDSTTTLDVHEAALRRRDQTAAAHSAAPVPITTLRAATATDWSWPGLLARPLTGPG